MTKETFLCGYAPLAVITDRIESSAPSFRRQVAKGVVFYNRIDVMDWVIQENHIFLISLTKAICDVAVKEERIDVLEKVWNNTKTSVSGCFLICSAVENGKLNVLKWLETKGVSIKKEYWAEKAAYGGHVNILQWFKEEQGLELAGKLYCNAIWGSVHMHVLKWLKEQACPWDIRLFLFASMEGKMNVLQWLHDEGCPWDQLPVHEADLKPEVVEWCRTNGYRDMVRVD